jgi:hypothetical protein
LDKARNKNDLAKQEDTVHPLDQKLADFAFAEILNRNYEDKYDNPVILAFVINDNSSKITAYRHSDGFKKKVCNGS